MITNNSVNFSNLSSWFFGLVVLAIGVSNLILVHPVPGVVGILLSFLFFPPVNKALGKALGFSIPLGVKIALFLVIIWFTLGISDLGEIMGF